MFTAGNHVSAELPDILEDSMDLKANITLPELQSCQKTKRPTFLLL
jgi:hypothetical protein